MRCQTLLEGKEYLKTIMSNLQPLFKYSSNCGVLCTAKIVFSGNVKEITQNVMTPYGFNEHQKMAKGKF
jgi:hypothetical protein